jgi:hypothetical protein
VESIDEWMVHAVENRRMDGQNKALPTSFFLMYVCMNVTFFVTACFYEMVEDI